MHHYVITAVLILYLHHPSRKNRNLWLDQFQVRSYLSLEVNILRLKPFRFLRVNPYVSNSRNTLCSAFPNLEKIGHCKQLVKSLLKYSPCELIIFYQRKSECRFRGALKRARPVGRCLPRQQIAWGPIWRRQISPNSTRLRENISENMKINFALFLLSNILSSGKL